MTILNKNLNIPGSKGVVSVGEFASGHIVRVGAIGTLRGLTFVAVNTDGTTKAFKSMWRAEKHLIRSDGR